jgi:hypothetical protein
MLVVAVAAEQITAQPLVALVRVAVQLELAAAAQHRMQVKVAVRVVQQLPHNLLVMVVAVLLLCLFLHQNTRELIQEAPQLALRVITPFLFGLRQGVTQHESLCKSRKRHRHRSY